MYNTPKYEQEFLKQQAENNALVRDQLEQKK